MTITREQVADLREGDVVEITHPEWPEGSSIRGPLVERPTAVRVYGTGYKDTGMHLLVCGQVFRDGTGLPWFGKGDLTVVSRAPRPLYVNHPRTEPVEKDIVRAPDGNGEMQTWICITAAGGTGRKQWVKPERSGWLHALPSGDAESRMCQPFRLLVDGETGQVVP